MARSTFSAPSASQMLFSHSCGQRVVASCSSPRKQGASRGLFLPVAIPSLYKPPSPFNLHSLPSTFPPLLIAFVCELRIISFFELSSSLSRNSWAQLCERAVLCHETRRGGGWRRLPTRARRTGATKSCVNYHRPVLSIFITLPLQLYLNFMLSIPSPHSL